MKLESPRVTIEKTNIEAFNFLSDVKNFELLMPNNIDKFEVYGDDKFLFSLKGMPEIILRKKDSIPHEKVVLGADGGKIDFSLTASIEAIDSEKSEVGLSFEGEFNAMMAMMIKGPISKFIATLTENMKTAI